MIAPHGSVDHNPESHLESRQVRIQCLDRGGLWALYIGFRSVAALALAASLAASAALAAQSAYECRDLISPAVDGLGAVLDSHELADFKKLKPILSAAREALREAGDNAEKRVDCYRVLRNKFVLCKDRFRLSDVFEAQTALASQASNAHFTWSAAGDGSVDFEVETDVYVLNHVVHTLLLNAAKQATCVHLDFVGQIGDALHFSVLDDGCGFHPGCDLFSPEGITGRVGQDEARNSLGLASSRLFASVSGGDVLLESTRVQRGDCAGFSKFGLSLGGRVTQRLTQADVALEKSTVKLCDRVRVVLVVPEAERDVVRRAVLGAKRGATNWVFEAFESPDFAKARLLECRDLPKTLAVVADKFPDGQDGADLVKWLGDVDFRGTVVSCAGGDAGDEHMRLGAKAAWPKAPKMGEVHKDLWRAFGDERRVGSRTSPGPRRRPHRRTLRIISTHHRPHVSSASPPSTHHLHALSAQASSASPAPPRQRAPLPALVPPPRPRRACAQIMASS
eukprot:CAMPEP_0184130078 /NCGR_PEP_ID=MMETSP0974-20121125/27414_1 /TAXON_ID=483370 /ORGANISM="non described non described, Strain CCMP2097" /LENGTH=507 /DNA_ID=CAMNT_0026433529 /DNA_START=54 /DNA_END=1574 /DNA_ORIENTATION=-